MANYGSYNQYPLQEPRQPGSYKPKNQEDHYSDDRWSLVGITNPDAYSWSVRGGPQAENAWKQMYDSTSQRYYYNNSLTGETSWTAPEGYQEYGGVQQDNTMQEFMRRVEEVSEEEEEGEQQQQRQEWIENWDDETQRPYWSNQITAKATWINPLPETMWDEKYDPSTRRPFWEHVETKRFTWTNPNRDRQPFPLSPQNLREHEQNEAEMDSGGSPNSVSMMSSPAPSYQTEEVVNSAGSVFSDDRMISGGSVFSAASTFSPRHYEHLNAREKAKQHKRERLWEGMTREKVRVGSSFATRLLVKLTKRLPKKDRSCDSRTDKQGHHPSLRSSCCSSQVAAID